MLPFLYFVKVVFEHPNAEQEVTILAFLLLHELMAVDVVSSIVFVSHAGKCLLIISCVSNLSCYSAVDIGYKVRGGTRKN